MCCGNVEVPLQFVRSYKHVGTKLASSATIGDETTVRVAVLREAIEPYSRRVLRNPDVTFETKMHVVNTLLLSKGTFQCGTWPDVHKSEFARITKSIMVAYRVVANLDSVDESSYASDCSVREAIGVLHPAALLRYHRIACVARVARKMSVQSLALLLAARGARRSWIRSLAVDVKWLGLSDTFQERGRGVAGWFRCCRAPKRAMQSLFKALREPRLIQAALVDACTIETAPVPVAHPAHD